MLQEKKKRSAELQPYVCPRIETYTYAPLLLCQTIGKKKKIITKALYVITAYHSPRIKRKLFQSQ